MKLQYLKQLFAIVASLSGKKMRLDRKITLVTIIITIAINL